MKKQKLGARADKGCLPTPNPQFFLTLFKGGGGGQTHVQKFWSKFCMILKAFWQHKIDMKDFLRAKMSHIEGKIV